LSKAGIEDVEITPWGIEPMASDEEKNIDLITVGNLIPLKNVGYFVRLCKVLHAENANFKALVVGDGPLRKQLENSVDQAFISSAVKFAGMIDHEKTMRMIARSKVLIHASNFEGFGMTMIEALSVGTKVLATPVGVALNNENVTHLTLNLEKDLALLKELLTQEPSTPVMYSIDTTVDRYLEIYTGL